MPDFGYRRCRLSDSFVRKPGGERHRNAVPEQHRDDGRFYCVDQAGVEERVEESAATEQPDIFARRSLQGSNTLGGIRVYD